MPPAPACVPLTAGADPGRGGGTGVSKGGGMTAGLACDAADLIRAAAPVAGGYRSLPGCHPARPVPILEIHGAADQIVPYRGTGSSGAGSVPAFLTQWRGLHSLHCSPPPPGPRTHVLGRGWGNCARGAVVQHDRVVDAGPRRARDAGL